jgi:hypothetical protein
VSPRSRAPDLPVQIQPVAKGWAPEGAAVSPKWVNLLTRVDGTPKGLHAETRPRESLGESASKLRR